MSEVEEKKSIRFSLECIRHGLKYNFMSNMHDDHTLIDIVESEIGKRYRGGGGNTPSETLSVGIEFIHSTNESLSNICTVLELWHAHTHTHTYNKPVSF